MSTHDITHDRTDDGNHGGKPTVIDFDVSPDDGTHDGTMNILFGAENGDISALIAAPVGSDRSDIEDVLEEIADSWGTVDEIVRAQDR